MFWISRPPYLRWLGAAVIVVLALWIELRPVATTLHPFVITDVARGEAIDAAIELREIHAGVLAAVPHNGYATHALSAGEPLLASDVAPTPFAPPDGWWIVDLELPRDAVVGSPIQLVILPDPGVPARSPIPGFVATLGVATSGFGAPESIGSVAFAPQDAATAAVAIANNRISVLIQHPNGVRGVVADK